VESLASEEVCSQLNLDLPLITEVSVIETSANTGKISVSWLKPQVEDLDTTIFTGPYTYKVYRSLDNNNFVEIASLTDNIFGNNNQLNYLDEALNTESLTEIFILPLMSQVPFSPD